MKRCPSCGKENPDMAKFCGYCGGGLPAAPEARPQPPQQAGSPYYGKPGMGVPPPPMDQSTAENYPPRPSRQGPVDAYAPPPGSGQTPYPPRQAPPPGPRRPVGQPPRGSQPAVPYMRQQPVVQSAGAGSSKQKMIIIAAIAVVLLLVVVCAVVGFWQQKKIIGLFNPSSQKTQAAKDAAKDISLGLTGTAMANPNIEATVQAQIQMAQTQAAGGQPQQPVPQQPPAEGTPNPATQPQAALAPDEKGYVDSLNQNLAAYDEAINQIGQLMASAQQDPNKLGDAQWLSDFDTAARKVNQISENVNKLTAPQKFTVIQEQALDIAKNYDSAIKLMNEFIKDKDQTKMAKANEAGDKAKMITGDIKNQLPALGAP